MDKILEQTLLFDFYGELLTSHQRDIYEQVVFDDYSLSEVAEEHGISRQGVHDLVRRCDKALHEYENKLGLVARFQETKRLVEEIHRLTQEFEQTGSGDCVKQIEQISLQIGDL